MTKSNIADILAKAHTIAVVGLSADPLKESNEVASYLIDAGYRVIPVNPTIEEVLGRKSYPDLASIPEPVDIVDIFRKPEAVGPVVDEAIATGAKVVWMQLGITNDEAARKAEAAGLQVIMDRCIKTEHQRLADLPQEE